MSDLQETPKTQETPRLHSKEQERIKPKDFKQFLVKDEEEQDEPKPSPMAAFAPATLTEQPVPLETPLVSNAQISAIAMDIVDTITVIEDKGIQTTTVDIGKGQFKGSSIKISLYDTDPMSYHVELVGSPEAMTQFHQNLPTLHESLTEKLPEHVFQLQAALSQDHQPSFKQKDKRRNPKASHTR